MRNEETRDVGSAAPIRTLIVDDEPHARRNLRIRLDQVPGFVVIGECATGGESVAAIRTIKPDLLFLDIQMPDMDGFAVLEEIDPDILPVVVFVTAYDRFALDAFRAHALDYLLKPFEEDRFAETLQACRQRVAEVRSLDRSAGASLQPLEPAGSHLPRSGDARGNPYLNRLVIKSSGRIFFMKISSLDWVEAYGNYVSLHAGGKTWLLRRTMHEMEAGLDPRSFGRLSRSAIVNLDSIQELVPAARGEYLVRLTDGSELKLTRSYREQLDALLGGRL